LTKVPHVFAAMHAGATHDTARLVLPGTTLKFSTAPVDVTGVTEGEAREAAPIPAEFVAVTRIVYGCPRVSPLTVQGLVEQVPVAPPGVAVAV
jgi:hypothetical protein